MPEDQRLQRIGRTARGSGEAVAGDRGADVGLGPKRAGYRASAGLLTGVCAAAGLPDPRCRARDLGLAFGTWSLSKLAKYLADVGIACRKREPSARSGMRWGALAATNAWKASIDPDFVAKMHRVLDLYDHPPTGSG